MRVPLWFLLALLVYAVADFIALYVSITNGWVIAAIVATWFASIIPMWVLGYAMEGGRNVLDPRLGSWTFIFGDSLGMPIVAACLAYAFSQTQIRPEAWMMLVCIAVGIAFAYAFKLYDNGNYSLAQLISPTKLLHDDVAYSVLAGVLVSLEVWALLHEATRPMALVALTGFGLWLAMGVADGFRHNPSPHIPYRWK